jgi:hypothetical protein
MAPHGVPGGVKILGPYSGKLDNSGEDVALKCPTLLPSGLFAMVQLEKVSYHNSTPWPPGTDGYGLSLQRRDPAAYGNDPANWRAAAPRPGACKDSDNDGIPDWWMVQYFGHPSSRGDDNSLANQDADGDGMTNLQKYLAGTDPRNPGSVFRACK